MKSAEEWINEHGFIFTNQTYLAKLTDKLRAIQNDARAQGLRDAAEMCRGVAMNASQREDYTIHICIGKLEGAADKLQPGKAQ